MKNPYIGLLRLCRCAVRKGFAFPRRSLFILQVEAPPRPALRAQWNVEYRIAAYAVPTGIGMHQATRTTGRGGASTKPGARQPSLPGLWR